MAPTLPRYPKISERTNAPLIPNITDTRLDLFYSANYASQDIGLLLDALRVDGSEYVKMTYWDAPGMDKPGFDKAIDKLAKEGKELKKGHVFGPSWSNHWVKVDITLPDEMKGDRQVIFEFDPSSEALIFTPDGLPLHAITGGKNTERDGGGGNQEDMRIEHIIPAKAVKSGRYQIYIEVACNGMFGVGMDNLRYTPPDMERTFPLVKADLVVPNAALRALWTDFRILSQVARSPHNSITSLQPRALKACNDIMNTWRQPQNDKGDEDPALLGGVIQECRDIAWEVLGSLSEESLKQLAPYKSGVQDPAMIWAIGHCHIDTAWLWRYTQTQQKVARSWTTQCDLMDRWPNHQFAASSAQQYYWLETLYPSGFDRVKAHVKGGRFHPVGGAWLEHDCMMPSGESLVRQYLYGQRYFKSRFGEYCREAWLPDTFGYASQLPQILRSAGLKYFFTQKLSWNNINVFPYSTFNWVALDGTQVLAHMTPVDSYNAQCNYDELTKAVWNNKNLSVAEEVLFLFGNGDGGGGPTPGMLEKIERLSSLAVKHGDVPSLKLGKPADFFDHLLETTHGGETLPTWRGELYLEFHRGTYTSQAHVKDGNRSMEQKLQALEYFATLASLTDSSYEYPRAELKEMWEDTMLNQFHDVLPGTTISLVVKDVLEIYEKRTKQADNLIQEALLYLSKGDKTGGNAVIDPLRIARSQVMDLDGKLQLVTVDHKGLGSISAASVAVTRAYTDGGSHVLENTDFKLTISNGRISSLIDRGLGRELILPGAGTSTGGLMIYEDYPLKYDAWDVEVYHLESGREVPFTSVETVENNVRSSLKATAKFGRSEVAMTISLDATEQSSSSDRSIISVDVQTDWHERHKVLKFALPVDIHSPHATYGTQFGLIERATHRNTTIEQAKFEVNGHMLADLSEPGYGVTLASRHKYGYAVEGNTMRMSLLRAPTSPDPETDQGKHSFSLAIMPHVGRLEDGSTYEQARAFTWPVYTCPGSVKPNLPQFSITGDKSKSIVLETIKRAEDEDKGRAIVLRLFESLGQRSSGKLTVSGIKATSCEWVNVLEEPLSEEDKEEIKFTQSDAGLEISLDFRCFEIKSLRVTLA